jgi:hypothetical protein
LFWFIVPNKFPNQIIHLFFIFLWYPPHSSFNLYTK